MFPNACITIRREGLAPTSSACISAFKRSPRNTLRSAFCLDSMRCSSLPADSSFDGHWFQCFVESVFISSGQLTDLIGRPATSAIGQEEALANFSPMAESRCWQSSNLEVPVTADSQNRLCAEISAYGLGNLYRELAYLGTFW